MFQPVVPFSGLSGWRFLQNTYDRQFETFAKSAELKRDVEYFSEKIGSVKTAEELVSDRRLLAVTLGAFGLQDDINNRFFIRKILEEGTTNNDSLANRFADPRYAELSKQFGFGPGEVQQNKSEGFAEGLVLRFQRNSFEIAAGSDNDAMRIALYAERKLAEISKADGSEDTKWFKIMGDPPLRTLFEKALNLPSSFGKIDIDQQLGVFKSRASRLLGSNSINELGAPEKLQNLITQFVVKDQVTGNAAGLSSGSIALSLLQNA